MSWRHHDFAGFPFHVHVLHRVYKCYNEYRYAFHRTMICLNVTLFACVMGFQTRYTQLDAIEATAINIICRTRELKGHWVKRLRYADEMTHYGDVIMSEMASQIIGVSIVCQTVGSGADQRRHQSSASLAFVREIHRSPVNFPHKGPVARKMFPFDEIIMFSQTFSWNIIFVFQSFHGSFWLKFSIGSKDQIERKVTTLDLNGLFHSK